MNPVGLSTRAAAHHHWGNLGGLRFGCAPAYKAPGNLLVHPREPGYRRVVDRSRLGPTALGSSRASVDSGVGRSEEQRHRHSDSSLYALTMRASQGRHRALAFAGRMTLMECFPAGRNLHGAQHGGRGQFFPALDHDGRPAVDLDHLVPSGVAVRNAKG